uniref:Uncharacterized protein n=1 Tax=Melanopsichium pennsylvanicum 4 TaxID=1398559 RepID=A0A077R625_9BASI|nr:uncharacterized protein BN887_06066 [Melanopsichium pennsylvanicum 4]
MQSTRKALAFDTHTVDKYYGIHRELAQEKVHTHDHIDHSFATEAQPTYINERQGFCVVAQMRRANDENAGTATDNELKKRDVSDMVTMPQNAGHSIRDVLEIPTPNPSLIHGRGATS